MTFSRRTIGFALALTMAVLSRATANAEVLDELKAQFNKDRGALRLVVLVSPTCPECVGGAGWIEDYVLKRYPDVPLKVYAIWYEMYPGDSPAAFPAAKQLMPDRRVTHWWDPTKSVGRWFTSVVPTNVNGEIQWDAFYLYGDNATWGDGITREGKQKDVKTEPLLTWGRTILTDRKKLSDKLAEVAGPPTVPVLELKPPSPQQ